MSDVWKNVIQFLSTVNGENKSREDYVTTPEAKEVECRIEELEPAWEKWMATLTEKDKRQAEDMKECLEAFASAMEQRSYIQGCVDCVQILSKIGLLKKTDIEMDGGE